MSDLLDQFNTAPAEGEAAPAAETPAVDAAASEPSDLFAAEGAVDVTASDSAPADAGAFFGGEEQSQPAGGDLLSEATGAADSGDGMIGGGEEAPAADGGLLGEATAGDAGLMGEAPADGAMMMGDEQPAESGALDENMFSSGGDSGFTHPVTEGAALSQWRMQHQQELEQKDEDSRTKKQQKEQEAEEALKNFYDEREQKKENGRKLNRESEKDFLVQYQSDMQAENSWERVTKLVDLKEKAGEQKDTSRFRQVLLHLKAQPLSVKVG